MASNRKYLVIGLLLLGVVSLVGAGIYLNQAPTIPPDAKSVLVSDFPELPVYPGAALVQSDKGRVDDGWSFRRVWESQIGIPQVMQWYIDNLRKDKWLVDLVPANLQDPMIQHLEMKRGEERLIVSVIRDQERNITRIVAEFPKQIESDQYEDEE